LLPISQAAELPVMLGEAFCDEVTSSRNICAINKSVDANFLAEEHVALYNACVVEGDSDKGRHIMAAMLPLTSVPDPVSSTLKTTIANIWKGE